MFFLTFVTREIRKQRLKINHRKYVQEKISEETEGEETGDNE